MKGNQKAIWLAALFTSCASGHSLMTMSSFYEVSLGSSSKELVDQMGEPYAVHKNEDGSLEYEYIERVKIGARDVEERRYFLLIRDGKVASKRVEQSSPPPYIFDSFDMQTTQSQGDEAE